LIATLAAIALTSGSAIAASTSSELVPASVAVGGHGYGYWAAARWRWRDSLPNVVPGKTSCFSAHQAGPIWFLGSTAGKANTVQVTCRIPAGRYLMVEGPGVECSTVEDPPFHAKSDAGLRTCVLRWWRAHKGGEDVTLDGTAIRPPGHLGGTSVFRFRMPAQNNYLHVPGRTGGRAVYYGAATILRPLSPGTHTLVWVESYTHPDSFLNVTYELTVG
jgi:hypothetical protein